MIDITAWMHGFLQALNETFENRVWFVGLLSKVIHDDKNCSVPKSFLIKVIF